MRIDRWIFLSGLFALFSLPLPAQDVTYCFPHMAEGQAGEIAYGTEFNLGNYHESAATVRLSFFDDEGAPWGVNLYSADRGDAAGPALTTTTFLLGPYETAHFVTLASGPLKVGWATLVSSLPLVASASFQEFRPEAGQLNWTAGVLPVTASSTCAFNANVSGADLNLGTPAVNMGFAIANPGVSPATVTVSLRDHAGGAPVSTKTVSVPAGGHYSRFLPELFDDVTWGDRFHGLAEFTSDLSVAVVALKGMTAGGRTIYSSLSVAPSYRLFKHIRTIQVTPDAKFSGGSFIRIDRHPLHGNFLVSFTATFDQPQNGCSGKGRAYKEYTTEMQETGTSQVFACDIVADANSMLLGSAYYLVSMSRQGEATGWRITKYDMSSWTALADIFYPLDSPREGDADPMIVAVNGLIDISSQYNESGHPPDDMSAGAATHHQFFNTDLQFQGKRILADAPHICGSSIIVVDGVTCFITASGFMGDVIVMRYDPAWQYLGTKVLRRAGHWPTGVVFDGQRYYVAYMDTSMRTPPPVYLPVNLNVRLAAFDRDWNLVDDVAVTSFTWTDLRQPGRPWVLLQGNRLYVAYDCDTIDPDTHEEMLQWQAYVSVFELER
jgi:hypothetical protein